MRILINGHNGYIGPALIDHLRTHRPDANIAGNDVDWFARHTLNGARGVAAVPNIAKDARDLSAADLEGFDAVVQLAAVSNDPMGKVFEAPTAAINEGAAVRTARLAREAGAGAFVFASSCSMYGAGSDAPRKETDTLNPLTAYARSKVAAEEKLEMLARPGFTVTALRFATACGLSPLLRLDLVLNDFVASAVINKRIDVLSDGSPWRPLVHLRDMARAIEWALIRDGAPFVAVNVGSDTWTWQMGDLANDVAKVLGGVEVSINRAAAPDKRSYRVDFLKFRALAPDHQPREDFASAVRDLAAALSEADIDADFRNSRYVRLKVLSGLVEDGALSADLRKM